MDELNSLESLYNRVKPALKSKSKDLSMLGLGYIKSTDIWNYLKNNVWNKSKNLTLADIVDDIMTVSNTDLDNYVKNLYLNGEKQIEEDDNNNGR